MTNLTMDFTWGRDAVKFLLLLIFLIIGAGFSGYLIGNQGQAGFNSIVTGIIVIALGMAVLLRPYLGIVFVVISLPLEAVLPSVPIGNSILAALGFLTIGAYIVNAKKEWRTKIALGLPLVMALVFVFWLSVSHPEYTLLVSRRGRSYFLTFVQLLAFIWLAKELMTPDRQRKLMVVYTIVVVVSAFVAIAEGEVGDSFGTSTRAAGWMGNANGLALYLSVGVVFSLYLNNSYAHIKWWRAVFPIVLALLIMGVVSTVSRLGLFALITGTIMYLWLSARLFPEQVKDNKKILFILLLLTLLVIPATYWSSIIESLQDAFFGAGGRSSRLDPRIGGLWPAAISAWLDHPVRGLGLGQFRVIGALYFDPLYADKAGAGVHNTFLSLLVETGAVGLSLFVGWLIVTGRQLWQVMQRSLPAQDRALALVWLIILVQISIIGLAHDAFYNKLLWLLSGLSLALWSAQERSVAAVKISGE